MKIELRKQTEWRRIFKWLPVTTMDNYRVYLGYVWTRLEVDPWNKVLDEWQFHTNPDGREDDYLLNIRRDEMGLPPCNSTARMPKCKPSLEDLPKTQQIRDRESGRPITEGSTLTKNMRGEKVVIPKRPPPPPKPPKARSVSYWV